MKSLEVQVNELRAEVAQKDFEIAALRASLHKKDITIARLERAETLRKCDLPADVVARLDAAFSMSVDNHGLRQAIGIEREKVCRLMG